MAVIADDGTLTDQASYKNWDVNLAESIVLQPHTSDASLLYQINVNNEDDFNKGWDYSYADILIMIEGQIDPYFSPSNIDWNLQIVGLMDGRRGLDRKDQPERPYPVWRDDGYFDLKMFPVPHTTMGYGPRHTNPTYRLRMIRMADDRIAMLGIIQADEASNHYADDGFGRRVWQWIVNLHARDPQIDTNRRSLIDLEVRDLVGNDQGYVRVQRRAFKAPATGGP